MKKLLPALLLVFAFSASAQIKLETLEGVTVNSEKVFTLLPERCSVGLKSIPGVRGLRLGMSRREIPEAFVGCSYGDGLRCFYRHENIKDTETAKGIDAITIEIDPITNLVSEFTIIYDTEIRWNSVQEFTEAISSSIGVSADKWLKLSPVSKKPIGETMRHSCANYELETLMLDEIYPQFRMSKTASLIKFEQNQKQQEKKKSFKP